MVISFSLSFALSVLAIFSVTIATFALADENLDTREGETLTLKCRFGEQQSSNDFTYYWARWTTANKYDNVAINNVQLNTNYR